MRMRDVAQWPFAVADAEISRQLTAVTGYRYAYDAHPRQYAPPAVSIVLPPEGKVARSLYGHGVVLSALDPVTRAPFPPPPSHNPSYTGVTRP